MRAKYDIQDGDFYNFNETRFIIDQITSGIVVTRSDQRGRSKAIQPNNREWATAIICDSEDSFHVPPFLLVKGVYYLAN